MELSFFSPILKHSPESGDRSVSLPVEQRGWQSPPRRLLARSIPEASLEPPPGPANEWSHCQYRLADGLVHLFWNVPKRAKGDKANLPRITSLTSSRTRFMSGSYPLRVPVTVGRQRGGLRSRLQKRIASGCLAHLPHLWVQPWMARDRARAPSWTREPRTGTKTERKHGPD